MKNKWYHDPIHLLHLGLAILFFVIPLTANCFKEYYKYGVC